MLAGLGDMLAKYVAICEWRISSVINDELFIDNVADMVRASLKTCIDNSDGLLCRGQEAAEAVFYGLATRLPHPWDSPSNNTGVGCHFLQSFTAWCCPVLL